MFTTGNQIRAARALIGWRRDELAEAAGLHVNAVKYWERLPSFSDREQNEPVGLRRIREALDEAGVMLIDDPAPGVYLARATAGEVEP